MNIAKYLIVIICVVIFSFNKLNAITLVNNGTSNYSIVIGIDASPSELHGADELQMFLQIISGAYLPIMRENETITGPAIFLGNSGKLQLIDNTINFQDLGKEGFVIKTTGEHLILAGGKLRGSMYAVYSFLEEKLGCRWYSSKVSHIPKISTITLGELNETQKPAFESRDPFWFDTFDADWSARNKCNGSTARLDAKRGGKVIYEGVHTFNMFIPHDSYFESHPEYFSELNRHRTFEQSQLCLTNPEVVGITRYKVLDWMKTRPEINIYGVGQNDYRAGACECIHCKPIDDREESHAGTLIYFVNKIAEYTEKYYPEKMIGTLAYHYTVNPPKYAKPGKNVNIRLCHMTSVYGCDAHPVTDCSQNMRFANDLRGWHKVTDNIYIWDYLTDFQHYMLPKPSFFATKKDLMFFRDMGVDGIFEQGAYESFGGSDAELQAYIEAKLMWNPNRDLYEIMDDFLNGYYGPAAKPIRKYYDMMYNKVFGEWLHFPINPQPTADYISSDVLAKADEYFDEAEQLAKGNPEIAYRVEAARLWIRYAKLAKPLEHVIEDGNYKPLPSVDAAARLRELESYMETCRNHGITLLEEYGTPREQLIKSYYSTYKIVTLENTNLKVDIIPGLGGRILQIKNKNTNRNLLRIASSKESGYPAPKGYSDGVLAVDELDYTIEKSNNGSKIVLTGYSSDYSIYCTKEINLPEGKSELEFSTTIEAKKDVTQPMRVQPLSNFDLFNCADLKFGFGESLSKISLQPIPQSDQLGNIRQIFWGASVPSNIFTFVNKTENTGIINVFDKGEIEGCTLTGNTETNTVGLSLQGILNPFKKGETRKVHHKYVFINDISNF